MVLMSPLVLALDEIAALSPLPRPRPEGGRRPISNRAALTGILLALPSGVPWEMMPSENSSGCGMSDWQRLRDWQEAGMWAERHQVLQERLHAAGAIDRSRTSLDPPRWTIVRDRSNFRHPAALGRTL